MHGGRWLQFHWRCWGPSPWIRCGLQQEVSGDHGGGGSQSSVHVCQMFHETIPVLGRFLNSFFVFSQYWVFHSHCWCFGLKRNYNNTLNINIFITLSHHDAQNNLTDHLNYEDVFSWIGVKRTLYWGRPQDHIRSVLTQNVLSEENHCSRSDGWYPLWVIFSHDNE